MAYQTEWFVGIKIYFDLSLPHKKYEFWPKSAV